MKVVTLSQAVTLVAATAAMVEAASDLFDDVGCVQFSNRGQFKRLVAEGFMDATQVDVDGKAAFVLFHGKTADDGLAINGCQSLRSGVSIDAAFVAAEAIRQRDNLKHIRFASIRSGLLEMAARHGYSFETVVMRKN